MNENNMLQYMPMRDRALLAFPGIGIAIIFISALKLLVIWGNEIIPECLSGNILNPLNRL